MAPNIWFVKTIILLTSKLCTRLAASVSSFLCCCPASSAGLRHGRIHHVRTHRGRRPVPSGKVTLICTAIEFAFRSAVYLDILDRVRALEKSQRENQSAGNNPPPPAPSRTQSQTTAPDQHPATDSKQDTSQGRRPQRAIFRRSAHSCPDPIVNGAQNFRQSAHTCSIRTPKTPVAQGSAVAPRASGEWSGQAAPSSTPQSARMDKEYALFRPFSLPGMPQISPARAAAKWRSLIE